MPARIVVIGSSNTDMVVRTPRVPAPGETLMGGDLQMVSGGKGANQAVAAARLGADVQLVARIGNDMFGDRALQEIEAAGVKTEYVIRDSERPSGVALICVADSGQNAIVVAQGANAHLSPADVDQARPAIETCDAVVLQFETPLATVLHAAALAHSLNKLVILNPAPVQPLTAEMLELIDVITPNELEAAMLQGMYPGVDIDPQTTCGDLHQRGARAIIITLGSKGAYVSSGKESGMIQGFEVEPVDTTAAGDCFTGALAVALSEGMNWLDSARFANAAAALSVTRSGAQPSMPDRAQVVVMLDQTKTIH